MAKAQKMKKRNKEVSQIYSKDWVQERKRKVQMTLTEIKVKKM
jgi:hypothetical protein